MDVCESLPIAREGNVFTRVCDSVHNRPHGYSVTVHPCWLLSHSLLRRGRYASYWNAFLVIPIHSIDIEIKPRFILLGFPRKKN